MWDIGGGLIALVAEQPLVAKQKILILLKTSHQSVDFCLIFIGQVWVSEFMYYFVRKIDFSRHFHPMWTDRSWVYIVVF